MSPVFCGATLFDKVQPDMSIYRDEIFGPVLCVLRVDSLGAAMKLINEHELAMAPVCSLEMERQPVIFLTIFRWVWSV